MAYDERFFLHYFRLMPNSRMLFGMRGGLFSSPAADHGMHRTIRSHFERCSPPGRMSKRPHSWNGLLEPRARSDALCRADRRDARRLYRAVAITATGWRWPAYAGAMLADLAQDRQPQADWPGIMRKPPRRFPLGRFRRAWLWPPYAVAKIMGD